MRSQKFEFLFRIGINFQWGHMPFYGTLVTTRSCQDQLSKDDLTIPRLGKIRELFGLWIGLCRIGEDCLVSRFHLSPDSPVWSLHTTCRCRSDLCRLRATRMGVSLKSRHPGDGDSNQAHVRYELPSPPTNSYITTHPRCPLSMIPTRSRVP